MTSYDYANQEGATFLQPYQVHKGDRLLARCQYDSRRRKTETRWGAAVTDEMCLTLTFYYPAKSAAMTCLSLQGRFFMHAIH